MALILVTGASGGLGPHVVRALQRRGHRVRGLVHRRAAEGCDETVRGDLADGASLATAAAGADAVVHLAGVTHARSARRYREGNVEGTRRLLDACRQAAVRRLVYASTRAISPHGGAYSISKGEAEELVRAGPIEHVIVRLPEIWAPGSREGISRLIEAVCAGRPAIIVGGGHELRPVTVHDAADALAAGVDAARAANRTYTLAGPPLTERAIAEACARDRPRIVEVPAAAIAALSPLARVLPLPLYPDQLARLRAPRPEPTPDAREDLGFAPRPLVDALDR